MKWVFLFLLVVLVPVLTTWLKANPRHAPKVWTFMAFLPFVLDPWNLYIAPISFGWPGFLSGSEISLLDAIALSVLLSRARAKSRLPLVLPFAGYVAAALLSVAQASVPMTALFFVWQLIRMFLLFVTVGRICEDSRAPAALIQGAVLGLTYHTIFALVDGLSGAVQTGASFGHQNVLGLASHFVALPALALLLAGEKGWSPVVGPLAGIVTAILGASRATIGLAGLGLVSVLLLSSARRWTPRKAKVLGIGFLIAALAAPLALASLDRRFEARPLGEHLYDERAAMERAAWLMVSDYPMGVGANHYVLVANTQGYSDRGGVIPTFGSRAAHVHNFYLLTAAETGFLGLATFLILLGSAIFLALKYSFRNRRDARGDLLLGLAVALAVGGLHSLYEWVLISFQLQYLLMMTMGMVAGLVQQLRRHNGKTVLAGDTPPPVRKPSLIPIQKGPRAGVR